MKKILVMMMCLSLWSCGSKFLEYPITPEFEECTVGEKSFITNIDRSPLPLPFVGRKEIHLFTDKPEFWDQFDGSIHLKSIKWNINWISRVSVIFDEFTVARWSGQEWFVSSAVDLSPFFRDKEGDPSRLVLDLILNGKGTKPAKAFMIEATAEFYFCGENADLMFDL